MSLHPELFGPNQARLKVQTLHGLSGQFLPCASFESEEQEYCSYRFLEDMKSHGLLRQLVRDEWKGTDDDFEGNIDRIRFHYVPGYGETRFSRFGKHQFFLDGYHSFIMCDTKTDNRVCASIDTAGNNKHFQNLVTRGFVAESDLIINQIQGSLQRWVQFRQRRKLPFKSEVIDNIRWPFVLVDLACLWALKSGYEQIFMTPANKNDNFFLSENARDTIGKEKYKRGKMRYDVTAQRLGFKMDPSSGLWKRDLKALTTVPYKGLISDTLEK